ncbi:hypothetical protein AXE65_00910 [Ventosimonas gracilis]|uniref:Uncharacterized protein n=1 Tax=Ventosimonas gracilis TaxID=1680762 RepID=A0A139SVG9_9GAMM|nr:hypothetical protein AXE65_00910 [Ventosimonas gracilis]
MSIKANDTRAEWIKIAKFGGIYPGMRNLIARQAHFKRCDTLLAEKYTVSSCCPAPIFTLLLP